MGWKVKFNDTADRQLRRLDKTTQKRVLDYLSERIVGSKIPQNSGKPLKGKLSGLWRYRVGDYRIICRIKNNIVTVMVLAIGHRKDIYK